MLGSRKKKSMQLSTDSDQLMPTRRLQSKVDQAGEEECTSVQAQAEEAPAEGGREREKRRLRKLRGSRPATAGRHQRALGLEHLFLPLTQTFLIKIANENRQIPADSDMSSSALTYNSTRPPSSTPGTTPAPSHLPTQCNSSPPPIPLPVGESDASATGLERRVRKSVNYAEPKLNTKVRKPDSMIGGPTQVKRTSSGGSPPLADDNVRSSPSDMNPAVTERRRKSRPRLPVDDDEESDGAQADEERLAASRAQVGLGNVDTRRRSAVVNTSRRSLIEDGEDRRHSMLV